MDILGLSDCFQDTLERSNNGSLKQRTARAVASNRVYKEGFVSKAKHRCEFGHADVCSGTTFSVARGYHLFGKTAVLNFADPEFPGGGVKFGVMEQGQEESLCRSSNLFSCISDQNVFDEYYGYHRSIRSSFYTDRLIYTKGVTVFKDDSPDPKLLPENDWFEVDVITCAAPNLAGRKHTNGAALLALLKSRVKNIFEAARDNHVDCIILGAFGCGAFQNPPRIVSEAFFQTIAEQDYFSDFKWIVFAIKPTGYNCPNLKTFSLQFDGCTEDAFDRLVYSPDPFEWRLRRSPALPTQSRFSDDKEFSSWQMDNRYFGKQFSILGDSISTLDGYNPKGYEVFYANENCAKSGVAESKDTWWDKVIGFFGGELLVNNSWSGSRVTKLKDKEGLFPSGCSDERTAALHIHNVIPDVILVYLGTNDWAYGARTGYEARMLFDEDNELFYGAYDTMLKKLRANYPESEIWCCTLCETFISKRPDFQFPHKFAGTHMEAYNEIIRDVVRRNGCRLIDLYGYKIPYDSMDGTHPNSAGMNTIATMVIREMVGQEADRFLDCENARHDYAVAEQYSGGTRCVCAKCAKVIRSTTLLPPQETTMNEKALAFLEAGMATFAKSGQKDEVSLKLIIAALTDAPLYFPVEIDLEAMLGSVDPAKLKAGDTLQPAKDVMMRILTLTSESGVEFVPTFTSNDEVNNGPSASTIRFYPQDYLPKLVQMDKPVIINPFSENRFLLSKQMITEVLLPLIKNKTKPNADALKQPADKYIGKTIVGKYEVLKLIGEAGFSPIYLVRDVHVNKVWDMKVYDKKNRHYSPAIIESILKEPYMMQKLDHPAIPKVADIIEDEDSIVCVRDHIEGINLEKIVKMYGAQSADKVIEWGKQMCSALGYLHSQNPPLIYRDMKPANVILKPDGTIKFIDFGIMCSYRQNQNGDTWRLGTRGYAAPEQFGGGQIDVRTDIFGLGMTMFRLVTGINPIEPPYEIKPICLVNPSLPKGLEYIISKCIKPNPNERYQSCDELMADLNNYLGLPKPKGIFGKLFGKE